MRGLGCELLFAWLHLSVLWAFAFAKPLFDVLADSPDFFVARGNTSSDVILLALAVTLVPPTLLVLLEALLFAFRHARRLLHLVFVGLLTAAIVVQVIGGWGGPAWMLIAFALVLGALAALAYARSRVAPAILSVLAPAPLVFVAVFLLFSPASKLVLPEDEVAASSAVRGSTPVVLVVFDEFSSSSLTGAGGQVDRGRFPHFAALARDATWYRNATTVADGTTHAVPAILSGLRPTGDRLPIASDYPSNLFTLLGGGYSLNVEEPATDLCPSRLCGADERASAASRLRALFDDLTVVSGRLLLPTDLEDRLPAVDRAFAGFRDDAAPPASEGVSGPSSALIDRVGRFDRFLEGVGRRPDRPSLHFLHTELPHVPWQYLPSGQTYPVSGSDPPGLTGDSWSSDPWPSTMSYKRYLLQVGFADRLLGRVMRRLRERGLYDRSLIVVTADHGVSFRAGQSRRLVTHRNVADIAGVPLFVKQPAQDAGRVDDGPARTIDILPSIARTLGVPLPEQTDGRPLQNERPADEAVTVSSYRGGATRVPFTAFARGRAAEARRRIGLFGHSDGFAGVFAAGPHPELVGRHLATLAAGGGAAFRVEFDAERAYSSVAPGNPEVPVYVTGRITGSSRPGEAVAVAVNSRIAAVTRSYRAGGDLRMAAIVSRTAFRKGADDVEALAVTASGAGAQLARAGRAGSRAATLVRRQGRLVVAQPGERPIPVTTDAADGRIELVGTRGNGLLVAGWASDPRHRRPADQVMLFADGRVLQTAAPSTPKPSLAERFGAGLARAGFAFGATGSAAQVAATPERLRVVAIVDGRASALKAATATTFPQPG